MCCRSPINFSLPWFAFVQIQRWTTRVQQLVEQNNKAKGELDELKSVQKSEAQNDKVISALKDENGRLKIQKDAMSKETLRLKKDIAETQVNSPTLLLEYVN